MEAVLSSSSRLSSGCLGEYVYLFEYGGVKTTHKPEAQGPTKREVIRNEYGSCYISLWRTDSLTWRGAISPKRFDGIDTAPKSNG
jgi:hypothetical protein